MKERPIICSPQATSRTRHFYDFECDKKWKDESITCAKCGWKGPGRDLTPGDCTFEAEFFDCPKCYDILVMVTHPTTEHFRQNWHRLTETEKKICENLENSKAAFEAQLLKDPAELPEIRDSAFTLVWDEVGPVSNPWTVILHGERIIWTEPAHFECYYRYLAIAPILKQKYGAALKDLVPTLGSQLDLYGDKIASLWWIADCRRELFGMSHEESNPNRTQSPAPKAPLGAGLETKAARLTRLGVSDRDSMKFAALVDACDAAITTAPPKRIHRDPAFKPNDEPARQTLANTQKPPKPHGRQIVAALRQVQTLVRDSSRSDALYKSLPGTHEGWLIDPDLARDLFEPHRWGNVWDKFHWSEIIDPITRRYTKDLFMRTAKSYSGNDGHLMLCLAGEAVGKSTVLGCLADSGLALPKILEWTPYDEDHWTRPNFGTDLIRTALKNEWKVHVMYIRRPVQSALQSIAARANETGWACALHEAQKSHRKSREILAEVWKEFQDDPRVTFSAFHNPGTAADKNLRAVEQIDLKEALMSSASKETGPETSSGKMR